MDTPLPNALEALRGKPNVTAEELKTHLAKITDAQGRCWNMGFIAATSWAGDRVPCEEWKAPYYKQRTREQCRYRYILLRTLKERGLNDDKLDRFVSALDR